MYKATFITVVHFEVYFTIFSDALKQAYYLSILWISHLEDMPAVMPRADRPALKTMTWESWG